MSSATILLFGFVASLALLGCGTLTCVVRRRRDRRYDNVRTWHVLCAFIFVSIYVFVICQEASGLAPSDTPILGSLFSTIQMFVLEKDIEVDGEVVRSLLPALAQPYLAYNAFLYLLAPLTTVGAALALMLRYAVLPLLWIRSRSRQTFLFSQLTYDSLELANSVADAVRSHVAAFADVDTCEDEELVAQARNDGHMLLSQNVCRLLRWCHRGTQLHVLFSSCKEVRNLGDALIVSKELSKKTAHPSRVTLHVFSGDSAAQSFADSAAALARKGTGDVRLRRLNRTQATVYRMLSEHPLFLPGAIEDGGNAGVSPYGSGHRHVLILGHDELSFEFLKAVLWCGRAPHLQFTIEVIDEDADLLLQRLAFECPEIHRLLGTEYHAVFRSAAPDSEDMLRALRLAAPRVTYTFVSLANDLQSIRVAKRAREIFEQERVRSGGLRTARPLLLTHVENPELAHTLVDVKAPKGQSYGLVAVGQRDELFSYATNFNPSLDVWARNLNRAYWGCYDMPVGDKRNELVATADLSYEMKEYNRSSSMASALFLKTDLFSFCQKAAEGGVDALNPTELPSMQEWCLPLSHSSFKKVLDAYDTFVNAHDVDWLQRIEHERWNAYMRSMGYKAADEDEYRAFFPATGRDQDQLARLHVCLVPYDELEQVDAMVERVEGSRRVMAFKDVDNVVIRHLATIVRDTSE